MAGALPDEVTWRVGKTRLGAQFDRAVARDRAVLEDVVERDPAALAAYVDVEALRGAYARYVASGDKQAGAVVWSAVTLGLWLRRQGIG
jgi:hypothetical protein